MASCIRHPRRSPRHFLKFSSRTSRSQQQGKLNTEKLPESEHLISNVGDCRGKLEAQGALIGLGNNLSSIYSTIIVRSVFRRFAISRLYGGAVYRTFT